MVNFKEKLKESGKKLKEGLVKVGDSIVSESKALGKSIKNAVKKENVVEDTIE